MELTYYIYCYYHSSNMGMGQVTYYILPHLGEHPETAAMTFRNGCWAFDLAFVD